MGRRQGRCRVGNIADAGQEARLQVTHLQDHRCHRRHQRKTGDALLADTFEDRLRKGEGFFEHERGAKPDGHQQLIKAVVEGKRKHIQNDVVGRVAQIGGDGVRRRVAIAVRHHHALGPAGRARRVDQHRQIDVDATVVDLPGFERQTVGQGCSPHRALAIGADGRSHEDAGVAAAGLGDHGHQFCLGEDRRSVAIGKDVGKLVGLGGWVDRDEGRPCLEHGENRNRDLPAIVHENDDPVVAPDAVCEKGSGKAAREIVQFFVAQPFMAGDQCRLGRLGSGIRGQKMFDPHGTLLADRA